MSRTKSSQNEISFNDIDSLRKDKSLRQKVKRELKKLELLSDTETDSSESSSDRYFDDSSDVSVHDSKKQIWH